MARAFAFTVTFAAALALVGGDQSRDQPYSRKFVRRQPALRDAGARSGSRFLFLRLACRASGPGPLPGRIMRLWRLLREDPEDVSGASCSSGQAEYEIVDEFPGATDPTAACEGVKDAKLGYLEQYTENAPIASSIVYCLGGIVQ